MSYIGNTPGVSSQRVVLEEVVTGSPKSAFTPVSGYIKGYLDVLVNGVEVDTADFTATDGVTVTLVTAAAVGDTVKIKTWLPRGLSDGYLKTEADAKFLAKAGGTVTGPLVMDTAFQNGLRILRDYNVTSGGPAGQSIQFGAKQGSTPVYPIELNAVTDSDGTAYAFSVLFNGGNALSINKTGNLVLPAGKGIDFSANANASGMTSEVLDDYETGTWTPTLSLDGTGHSYSYFTRKYIKVGKQVTVFFGFHVTNVAPQSAGVLYINGLPFTADGSASTYENGVSALMTERMGGAYSAAAPHSWYVGGVSGTTQLCIFEQNYNGSIASSTYFTSGSKSSVQTGGTNVYFLGQHTYTTT